jgi:hypothetical protein
MAILNLTNFDDHPEDPNWMVFRFPENRQAEEFIAGLDAEGIGHERDAGGPPFLVGVKQYHRERAVRINYTVVGRHREPFIADRAFRWGLLAFVGVIVLLAVVGWIVQLLR